MPLPDDLPSILADRYELKRELGAGGMATVYLAHDTKHDRPVAVKVLHAALAAVLGTDRFLREIRVTANLQHPHILGLIDSGLIGASAGAFSGRPYYVMPFIEGESLRQRLEREQQLAVDDAVRITTEVASALDYAHRHGVIHRDIKPENILLHDGSAIVADFGIALAITEAGGGRVTETGISLGTPQYMSPEQAMGEKAITGRSDIYSLGATIYEMLSGEPPFSGPTVQVIVSRIVTEEPRPLPAQRRSVPPHVDAAVRKALQKVPADRFATAHEFAAALHNPSFTLDSGVVTGIGQRVARRPATYALAAAALVVVLATLASWMRTAPPQPVRRYPLALDSAETLAPSGDYNSRLAISPDGSLLAYSGASGVLLRRRDQLHATPVRGSDGGLTPFFSPDGRYVGFNMGGVIAIAPVNGGEPTEIGDGSIGIAGAAWGADGYVYADAQSNRLGGGLLRIRAMTPHDTVGAFTQLDTASGEIDHVWPDVLPNGKGVLFTIVSGDVSQGQRFSVGVAEIPSGKHRVLIADAMRPRYVRSGHLLYVTKNRTLMVVPFDARTMTISGEPSPVAEGLRVGYYAAADVAVSDNGTLVYAAGSERQNDELVWVTRAGKVQRLDSLWRAPILDAALSPDEKRLALVVWNQEGVRDIWIKSLDRSSILKLSVEGGNNKDVAWTPDGRFVTYTSTQAGHTQIWNKPADGSGPAMRLVRDTREQYGATWSPDGNWLVFYTGLDGHGGPDIVGVRRGSDSVPVALVATSAAEIQPAVSPDGRWLAYASSGQSPQVFVVPFPNTHAARWQVSTTGGYLPRWSHDGTELFYHDLSDNIVAVPVKETPTFSPGPPRLIIRAAVVGPNSAILGVGAGGQRFLAMRPIGRTPPDQLMVVDNWFEELRAKRKP
jgi:eukaryotic-like serine/threonine-protein kinase